MQDVLKNYITSMLHVDSISLACPMKDNRLNVAYLENLRISMPFPLPLSCISTSPPHPQFLSHYT